MTYKFTKAVRDEVGLLIGLIGPSGSGKTYSAMRLASGMVEPGKRFAVIDTENGRAKHYADLFDFDHAEMHDPFRPDAYADAIKAAADAGYKVIVVDSMSHEWAGVGGILEWQEEELTRMAGDNWQKREACKMASWIKPKMSHKAMIQRLLQVNAHLILCFRAEEKVKMEKDKDNKMQIIPVGWQPICSKELPYELTVSMLLTPESPGVPQFLKLQEQHKALFPVGKLIDESAGKAVSAWAKGGAKPSRSAAPAPIEAEIVTDPENAAQDLASEQQHSDLRGLYDALTPKVANAIAAQVLGHKLVARTLTEAEAEHLIEKLSKALPLEPANAEEPTTGPLDEE